MFFYRRPDVKTTFLIFLIAVNAFCSVAVTTLRFRNHTIQIKATKAEPLYTLFDQKGQLLAKEMTAENLRVKHPDLFELVRTAIASNEEVIDASLQKQETKSFP